MGQGQASELLDRGKRRFGLSRFLANLEPLCFGGRDAQHVRKSQPGLPKD